MMAESRPDVPTKLPWSEKRIAVFLFLLVVIATGFWVRPIGPQEASRMALTAALVDGRTVVLDGYEHILQMDRAVRDGHIYSDKAPGQPFLAVPFYALYRIAGGEPLAEASLVGVHVAQWWLTLWFAAVPLGILTVLIHLYLKSRFAQSLVPTLMVIGGTILLPFGSMLFAHVLAAGLLFAAFYIGSHRKGPLLPVGFLLGLAVVVEYTAIIGVIVLLALLVYERRTEVRWVLPGGLVMVALLMWYNAVAFGDPFVVAYQYTAFTEVTDSARPLLRPFRGLQLNNLIDLLVSPRGFIVATPVVLVGAAGLIYLWRDAEIQARAIACSFVFLFFLLVPILWSNPWGGMSPGPRYMTPAFPFLASGVAMMWARSRLITLVTAVTSGVTMVASVVTEPRILPFAQGALGFWSRSILVGDFSLTIFDLVIGHDIGILLVLLGTLGAVGMLWKANRTHVLSPS